LRFCEDEYDTALPCRLITKRRIRFARLVRTPASAVHESIRAGTVGARERADFRTEARDELGTDGRDSLRARRLAGHEVPPDKRSEERADDHGHA
jgi:hypothetical protein